MSLQTNTRVESWQNAQSEKNRDRFYGKYMGFVKRRDDPECRGRVCLTIPSLMPTGGLTDWCLPQTQGLQIPPLGAAVWVEFEQGQIQYGVYSWGWFLGDSPNTSNAPKIGKEENDGTLKGQIRNDAGGQGVDFGATITADTALTNLPLYGYNKTFESEGGHLWEMDDTPNRKRFRYRHPSGTSLLVDPDGSLHVRTAGAVYQEVEGDFVVNLRVGASFKVIYPDGTSLVIGASGAHIKGHQTTVQGRFVRNNGENI